MDFFILALEMVGTVSFAVSGAMTGLRKNMDVFGVCILGLVTAVGGGAFRDVLLGRLPPLMLQNPLYALVAICASAVVFFPGIRRALTRSGRVYEVTMRLTDSVGLGIFTVSGVAAAWQALPESNWFTAVFLGTLTGVGGGAIRDVLAGDTPGIFVKHIYACAAIAGALVQIAARQWLGETAAMLTGCGAIAAIRLLAAHYHWSLPRAGEAALSEETVL